MTTTSPKPLIAFHGDPALKTKYLDRVEAHRQADEIIQGQYWDKGRGCGIGCTIHGSDHSLYEKKLGIPVAVARLEDAIFEGLPYGEAKGFPGAFLRAITPGADLSMVAPEFTLWLLTNPELDLAGKADETGKKSLKTVTDLYRRWVDGSKPPEAEWRVARRAAWAAAPGVTRGVARAVARAAAWDVVWGAAWDVVWAVARAAAWDDAWRVSRAFAWMAMAKQLLAILEDSPAQI
jgi:hypothetical protein